MQPGLPFHVVMACVDSLDEHVRVVPVQAGHFLFQADHRPRHQIVVTGSPQIAAMRNRPWHASTRRVDRVLGNDLCVERRELAVPVDDLLAHLTHSVHHRSAGQIGRRP